MKNIKYILSLFVATSLLVLGACNDNPTPNHSFFLKYFGDDGFQTCSDFEVDSDGYFYMVGTSGNGAGNTDSLFLVKADPGGALVWKRTIRPGVFENNGRTGMGIQARDIELLSDGSMIVTGNVYMTAGDRDIFVAKFSREAGELLRGNSFSPYNNEGQSDALPHDDEAFTITEISDGGFIIAGYSSGLSRSAGQTAHVRDGVHIRLDNNLVMLPKADWKQVLDQGIVTVETKVVQLDEHTFYTFGYGSGGDPSIPDINFTASKIDSAGKTSPVLSTGTTFGIDNANERLGSVCLLSGNGINDTYFMLGISTPAGAVPSSQLFAAAMVQSEDNSGEQILTPSAVPSTVSFPGLGLRTPGTAYTSCIASASGGILVLTNESTNGESNWLLIRLATDGSQLWQKAITFGGEGDDFAGSVKELSDGKIIISGTFSLGGKLGETKMVLMKLNSLGRLAD